MLQVIQRLIDPTFSEQSHGFMPNRRSHDAVLAAQLFVQLGKRIMVNGVVLNRKEDIPQGGPLSPLLANIMLDEVDKELEKRGYNFARYADDCNVYASSRKSGERVMALLKQRYAKLRLKINESKSAVASVFGRTFLGYSLWVCPGGAIKRRVADKASKAYKQRVRQLT